MKSFAIFICLAFFFGVSFAEFTAFDVKVNVFDRRSRDFERNVIESSKIVKSFIARDDIALAITAGSAALSFLPFEIAKLYKLIPLTRQILSDKSDWRDAFTKAIADETMRNVVESEVRWMEATMETIQSKIILLGDENPSNESRRNTASNMHIEIDRMINFFDIKSSLFRKYPLVGAPPLLQLASLVIVFNTIAKILIPLEAENPQIACKMHDVLVDYLPRTINARLHELHSNSSIFRPIVKAMSLPYSAHGYGVAIRCDIGCRPDVTFSFCLRDKFSTLELLGTDPDCVIDYAALVRHHVEEMFPIDVLKNQCNREPQIPSGFGWFTINIQHVYAYCRANGISCVTNNKYGCDSYISLFINDENVLKSPKEVNKISYDANITFTTGRISKSSSIRIEVKDGNSGDLILNAEGNVESFLKNRPREGETSCSHMKKNSIETVSFWRDDYR